MFFTASLFAAQPQAKVKFKGKMEVIHIDRDGDNSEFKYFLHHDGIKHELKFKKRPEVLTDADAEVDGVESADGSTIDVEVIQLMTIFPNTFGAQKTLVMLVNFSDNGAQPYSLAFAQGVFNTVSNFDRENSFMQAWLANAANQADQVDVRGWVTLAVAGAGCDYNTIASQADQAATAAGAVLSQYRRKVYAFPGGSCGWWGLGTIGGNPSRAWISGSLELAVVGHEMGHNFGLQHSHRICAPGCTLVEYGDTWDTMGNARGLGHYNAYQKERLGWLNYGVSPPITTVTTAGQYRIGPYETNVMEPKALKIFKGTSGVNGSKLYYYVEYRAGLGSDSGLQKAVIVHVGNELDSYDINLWDLDQTGSAEDWILDVGQVYTDGLAGVSFSLASMDASGAFINVTMGSVLGAPTNLAVK